MADRAFQIAADAVVALHFAFVLFVILGGAVAVWWPRVMWVHVPAALWGVLIEFSGRICPLTPLENYFLRKSGAAGYEGDFLAHHLLSVLYPGGLTRNSQLMLGGFVIAINTLIYGFIVLRRRSTG